MPEALRFSRAKGRVVSNYHKCGRKPWKFTKPVERYLVRRLQYLRSKCVCTSTTLQRDLARNKGVTVSDSAVRKVLAKHGFKWLPRRQKRKYSPAQKDDRIEFARNVLRLTAAQLREKLSLAMDGVILSLPPADPTDRFNFCKYGDTHMWRKPSEALDPNLAGADNYGKQVPLARALPLWGGCSANGFSVILFHPSKKCSPDEWAAAVSKGKLTAAIRVLRPVRPRGPWHVLCDNEHFLTSTVSQNAHRRASIHLWKVPPHSPDLNPVERFWSWLRRKLRSMDLNDVTVGRRVLCKSAYKARVVRLLRTQKAQAVASQVAKGLPNACREVIRNHGAAVRG